MLIGALPFIDTDGANNSGYTLDSGSARSGAKGLHISNLVSGTAQGVYVNVSSHAQTYALIAVRVVAWANVANTIVKFMTSSGLTSGDNGRILLNTDGTLTLKQAATTLGSVSPILAADGTTWYIIELFSNATPASGSRVLTAKLNGTQFATSAVRTQAACVYIAVGGNLGTGSAETASSGEWAFDGLVVNDNTGSLNNTWLSSYGDARVLGILPSGAGDANSFATQTGGTAGAANNYTRVNESPADDATSFNGSSTLNQEDLFAAAIEASGVPAGSTILGVGLHCKIRNSAADTAAALRLEIEKTTGGTKAQSADIIPNNTAWTINPVGSVGTGPHNFPLVAETDPDGAAWTPATLGTMQIGYKLTTAPGTAGRRIDVTKVWGAVVFIPSTNQAIAPGADSGTQTWDRQPGGGKDVYQAIDEAVADNSDYIESPTIAQGGSTIEQKVAIAQAGAPATKNNFSVGFRYAKDQASGDPINLTVTLYRADGTTSLGSKTITGITNAITDDTLSISDGNAATVPDSEFTDPDPANRLKVGFKAAPG